MTQRSYFWGGTTTGDATLAPYDDDEFSDFIRNITTYDRTVAGVVLSNLSGYSGNLEVTNPSGTTARVGTGIALVDGKMYTNDAAVDFSCSTSGQYYRIVLRKSFSAQTVRAALLGPGSTVPALTQTDGTTWEIPLATVYNSSGTLVITDERSYIPAIRTQNIVDGSVTAAKLGAGAAYVQLRTTTIGAGGGTVNWTGLPYSNYSSYMIVYTARSSGTSATYEFVGIRFNGDTGSNYDSGILEGNPLSGGAGFSYYLGSTIGRAGTIVNNNSSPTAQYFGSGQIIIANINNANTYKTAQYHSGAISNVYPLSATGSVTWRSTSSINQIYLAAYDNVSINNFVQYSTFTLYGLP